MNTEQFHAAFKGPEIEQDLQKFIDDHKLGVSPAQLITIAKMICAGIKGVDGGICPIVNDL